MTEGKYRLDLDKIPITLATFIADGSDVRFPWKVFVNNYSKKFMFLYPCYKGVEGYRDVWYLGGIETIRGINLGV